MTTIVINTQSHALLSLINHLNFDGRDLPLDREQQKGLIRDARMIIEDAFFDGFELIDEYGDDLLRELVCLVILELNSSINHFGTYHELLAIVPYDIAGSIILVLAKNDHRSS